MPRKEVLLIEPGRAFKSCERNAQGNCKGIDVTRAKSLTNDPTTIIAHYKCGRDALLALGRLTEWVDDKWNAPRRLRLVAALQS